VKKKSSIPLDQVIKKVMTFFNRSGSNRGLSPPNPLSIPPKSSSSLPMKSFFNSLYTITKPQKKLKATPMLLILRWICLCRVRPENTEENQPITNLNPRTFANTTDTGKNVKDSPEDCFFAQIYIMQVE